MLVRIWQYEVAPGFELEFERFYDGSGAWARLFRNSPGYLGTGLFRSVELPRRYVTIDRFTDAESWGQFFLTHRQEYEALDARCARLTVSEVELAG